MVPDAMAVDGPSYEEWDLMANATQQSPSQQPAPQLPPQLSLADPLALTSSLPSVYPLRLSRKRTYSNSYAQASSTLPSRHSAEKRACYRLDQDTRNSQSRSLLDRYRLKKGMITVPAKSNRVYDSLRLEAIDLPHQPTALPPLNPPSAARAARKRTYDSYKQDIGQVPSDLERRTSNIIPKGVKFRAHKYSPGEIPPFFRSDRNTLSTATKYPNLARVVPRSPAQQQEAEEHIARAATNPIRHIGGMLTTLFVSGCALVASAWSAISAAAAATVAATIVRVAIETDSSGRKRRAVEVGTSQPTMPQSAPGASPQLLPGSFPEERKPDSPADGAAPAQLSTPPDSRRNSSPSSTSKEDSPAAEQADGLLAGETAQLAIAPPEGNEPHRPTAMPRRAAPVLSRVPVRRLPPPTVDGLAKRGAATAEELKLSLEEPSEVQGSGKSIRVRKIHELTARELEAIRLARERQEREDYYVAKDQRAWEKYQHRIEKARALAVEERERKKVLAELEAHNAALRLAAEQEAQTEAKRLEKEAQLAEEARQSDPEYIEKQKLIRPVDPEWEQRIEQIMAINYRDSTHIQTADGTDISRHDLDTLLSQEDSGGPKNPWLNDEIVNGILSGIVARKLEQTGYTKGPTISPAFGFLPSQWYNNVKAKGMQSISRWSRRKGFTGEKLLGCEKIFLPVNTGAHWMLLIISPKDRKLEFLDSLNQVGKTKEHLFGLAREWLAMELGTKYVADEWQELSSKSARQLNSDDCGVFTCFNALAAAKGRAFSEVGKGDMSDARRILAAVLINGGFKNDWEL